MIGAPHGVRRSRDGRVKAEAGLRHARPVACARKAAMGVSPSLLRSRCFALAEPGCQSVRPLCRAAGF